VITLNRSNLAQGKYQVDVAAASKLVPVGILQIGDGNFLRAFGDWMIDIANGAGLMNGQVTIAQPLPQGIAGMLNAQDGLYTVLLRGVQGGKPVDSRRVVTCVAKALDPYGQWDAMLACATDRTLRFVISNTTEAGIAYTAEPMVAGKCPASFPAKVTALHRARIDALGGAAPGLCSCPAG
jgi:tagaturonate reductase